LPTNSTSAAADGTTYATTNDPGSTVNVTTNYASSPTRVKVTVTANTPSFFGQLFGVTRETVSASAVAGTNVGPADAAIFASDTTCGSGNGVTLSGDSSANINGGVDSNGSFTATGNSSITTCAVTYGGPNSCASTVSGNSSASFASGPTPHTSTYPWPKDYSSLNPSVNPSICTVTASSFHWDGQSSFSIPAGVYCATGPITITGNSSLTANNVTLIGNSVTITGNSSLSMTPDAAALPAGLNDLAVYQTGTGTCAIQGSTLNSSTVFVPNGTLSLTGTSSGTVSGYLEAKDVKISGDSSFTLTGRGPSVGGGSGSSLIQ